MFVLRVQWSKKGDKFSRCRETLTGEERSREFLESSVPDIETSSNYKQIVDGRFFLGGGGWEWGA